MFYLQKNLLHPMTVLDRTMGKRGMVLAFTAYFLYDSVFHNNVPYLIIYLQTKFQCHTFLPSQDIKQNVLLSSYSDN